MNAETYTQHLVQLCHSLKKHRRCFLGEWQTYSLSRRAEMIFRLMADVQPETICRKIYASQRQQYLKHWKPI